MGEVLQEGDFEFTLFKHLYNEYRALVLGAEGLDRNKRRERFDKAEVMWDAWAQYVPTGSAWIGRRWLSKIEVDYTQVAYWRALLGEHFAQAKAAEPKQVKYPAGYEQAFQSIVYQSKTEEAESISLDALIDWSKFCHLHENLRKTWDIELSTDFYTDTSGQPKKLGTRKLKDNPQA